MEDFRIFLEDLVAKGTIFNAKDFLIIVLNFYRSPCKINTQVPLSYKTPQRSNEISMIDENSIESFIACKSNQNQLNRRIASSNVSKPFLSQFE